MGVCRKHCVEKAQKKLKHFICFGKVREQINKKTKTETDRHPIAIEDGYKSKLFSFTSYEHGHFATAKVIDKIG